MSEHKSGAGADADDLATAPYLDEAERAESEWLLARDRDPAAPAPSPELAAEHSELAGLLCDLPLGPKDTSWRAPVLAQVRSPPRRRRAARWAIAGALAAAAAVAVVLLTRPRPAPGELEVVIQPGDAVRGDAREPAVGDRLIIKAHPRGAADLRVYRAGGTLVARCPSGPGCVNSAPGEQAIEIRLEAPVQHHVILVIGATGDLPAGPMDAYLEAAQAAKARIVIDAIEVH